MMKQLSLLPFALIPVCLFLLVLANSCKPPRSPIIDSQVRMIHRYDGELGIPTRTDTQEEPNEFSTDATRVEEKPKGIKKLLSVFKKKHKEGPDENDLKVEYNPNLNKSNKVDSLKPNVDQLTYEQKIRPSAGPEVRLDNSNPEQEYRGVPWWYPNKNAKIGQGYKPGYRYPGYRDLTTEKRLSYYKKSMKLAKKNQEKRRKQFVKDSARYVKSEERKAVAQKEEDAYQQEVQRRKEIDPFGELGEVKRKKKGIMGIFKKKPKKDKQPPDSNEQPADKPQEKKDEF
jgi:hypothetical protein